MAQQQFPGMIPLQYAQAPDLAAQLQGLAKAGQPLAKMAGQAYNAPPAPPAGPPPMNIAPAATNAGTNAPPSGILDAIKGMSPQMILDRLRAMSSQGQQVIPPGLPGSAALQGAGMLGAPMAAPPLSPNLIAGG